jgi:phosphoglycerol transferase MdoB-like AlkP superfamily enzyme
VASISHSSGMTTVKSKSAYRVAIGLGVAASLFLLMLIGAVGVIGVEGDPFDFVYFGVVGIGVVGALIARFRARGMVYALFSMALAQAVVVAVALIIGKQDSPVSSVTEIVGLNGFFIVLFVASALLFRRAARS